MVDGMEEMKRVMQAPRSPYKTLSVTGQPYPNRFDRGGPLATRPKDQISSRKA